MLGYGFVSIHAPWEGCDDTKRARHIGQAVSIHAPWEGCDYQCMLRAIPYHVSIHAPWEGCDWRFWFFRLLWSCFNSRTLGRVRPPRYCEYKACYDVSIHAPWEGCDSSLLRYLMLRRKVSIHAPWEGCDRYLRVSSLAPTKFQFTHPGKGATTFPIQYSSETWSFNSRTLGRVRL